MNIKNNIIILILTITAIACHEKTCQERYDECAINIPNDIYECLAIVDSGEGGCVKDAATQACWAILASSWADCFSGCSDIEVSISQCEYSSYKIAEDCFSECSEPNSCTDELNERLNVCDSIAGH